MMEAVWAALGALAGGAVVWFWRRAREAESLLEEREARARLEAQLSEGERRIAEQKALLDEARGKLQDTFKALASEALHSSNEEFLRLAQQTLEKHIALASGDLDLRKKAVEDLVKPINEALLKVQEKADLMEKDRRTAYGDLRGQLQSMAQTQERLRQETGNLVSALRQPGVRGRWGELTLRRVVELAGLSAHCDFTEQQTTEGEEGALRPDLVVHLPNRREIVVDSKAVLSAYLEAHEAADDVQRQAALQRHAGHLRDRIRALSAKRYWERYAGSADFVVLFVPGEPFLAAAVERDPDLLEDALKDRVVVATPSTLVALLKAVYFGWQQERMAENAREVADLGKKLLDAVAVWSVHLKKLRGAVFDVVQQFNSAQGSLESNVLPKARRMKELGVASEREIPAIEPVTEVPRAVEPPES
jgi:DNA recombination protein RmuC